MERAEIIKEILKRLNEKHIGCFKDMDFPLFLISEQYPGLWLEHLYDSVFYAQMDKSKLYLAENAIRLFLSYQKEDGQLPAYVRDGNRINSENYLGFGQIQECVSFASLCYKVYLLNGSKDFLRKCFEASKKWVLWLKNNRMTKNAGLIEMFVGFDTGHDNSARLQGLSCRGNYQIDGKTQNASVLPPNETVAPIFAVDMNCNFYGNLMSLYKMATELNEDGSKYYTEAQKVKKRLFEVCFDENDCFFYDADRNFSKRKILSSAIFHLFIEKVLDKEEDKELIHKIFKKYVLNEKHFYTPYPFPSVSISDPGWKKQTPSNCWGYFTQGLIALRTTLWMDEYGLNKEMDNLCQKWLQAWTACFDRFKLGQELDPITGEPSPSSEWYSSCMLFYLYSASRCAI